MGRGDEVRAPRAPFPSALLAGPAARRGLIGAAASGSAARSARRRLCVCPSCRGGGSGCSRATVSRCPLGALAIPGFPFSPLHLPKANPAGSLDPGAGSAGGRDEGKLWGAGAKCLGWPRWPAGEGEGRRRLGPPGPPPGWGRGGGAGVRGSLRVRNLGWKGGDLGSLNQDLGGEEHEESNPVKSPLAVGRVPFDYRDEAPGSRLVSLLRNEGGGLTSLTVGAAAKGVGRHRVPARG